jgi:hypothetical protein
VWKLCLYLLAGVLVVFGAGSDTHRVGMPLAWWGLTGACQGVPLDGGPDGGYGEPVVGVQHHDAWVLPNTQFVLLSIRSLSKGVFS